MIMVSPRFNLTSEGMDIFSAKIDLEVQWACEQ